MRRIVTTLLLTAALAAGPALPAAAHKVVAGAYAAGDQIEGEVGFSDGSMANNALVEVLAEDGSKIGETHTNPEGVFTFTPTRSIVHIFRVDLGGGHVAEVRLDVADLPAALRAPAAASAPTGPATTPAAPSAAVADRPPTPAQQAAFASALRDELRPLRREIIALKEKNDLQSVLGGIGYIVGLFGLWFFLAARRQMRKAGGH
ncbi:MULTISPECIES: cobalt ABC transporter permease [unclassified Xanthobacter]|uniref:cobalt ABC transporter permease n=1 Tax=unclassified Xanthobacter TaxID=2623496 RepID=UPI001EE1153A|nr:MULTISPECIES: cobalt ABC transporter permease [unclassified Xanthobacter]